MPPRKAVSRHSETKVCCTCFAENTCFLLNFPFLVAQFAVPVFFNFLWLVMGSLRWSFRKHNRRDSGARKMLLTTAQQLIDELESERRLIKVQAP